MKVPRDIAGRVNKILEAVKLKLPPRPTEADVRHAIQEEMAEERFFELFKIWSAEFEETMNARDPRRIEEAYDELILRIQTDHTMEASWLGPTLDEKFGDQAEGEYCARTFADIYSSIARASCTSLLVRNRIAARDSEGFEPKLWEGD